MFGTLTSGLMDICWKLTPNDNYEHPLKRKENKSLCVRAHDCQTDEYKYYHTSHK